MGNLVDQGSSIYIFDWDSFKRLRLNPEELKPFKGLLVGFLGEHVQVKDYPLKIMFGE